jgi:hypothetical protein
VVYASCFINKSGEEPNFLEASQTRGFQKNPLEPTNQPSKTLN